MLVPVVRIRYVRVHMAQRFVHMPMAVRPRRHHFVTVTVVPVVVAVRMLMRHRLVFVFMTVRLRQMQHHAEDHEHAARGQAGADEGREGEDGTRARRAERPLRQQVAMSARWRRRCCPPCAENRAAATGRFG